MVRRGTDVCEVCRGVDMCRRQIEDTGRVVGGVDTEIMFERPCRTPNS